MKLDLLPDDCFAHILSFTSPKDACRLSIVSSELQSSADSDSVWEKLLPPDYLDTISRLTSPWSWKTKKELFFRSCDPHFIDIGRKIISLDKSTGKKVHVLSSRELSISWATNPLYWSWKSYIHSRFSEVAELRTICWLQINGKFNTENLSPKTLYGAYLIVKFASRAYGLDTLPSEVFVKVGNFISQAKIFLRRRQRKIENSEKNVRILNRIEASRFNDESNRVCERKDGWIEIELGSFYNDAREDKKDIEMGLKEVTGEHLKGGLIVEGIEIKPKK
ncbi:F-box protein PP2-B15-like [Euphorbia lathyris]|uniref:F-box protein PP2-B15-like n=1 Tax=Euphorbia lathyris TaxID=212925 RepID=UPI00331317ED